MLVVLYEGARGDSARQIHNTLRLPWNVDVTRIGFRDIHRHLRVSTFVMETELGYTCNLQVLRARSQSYGTEKRTDFSPTAWTPPQEAKEWCRIGWLQALTESRSFCFPLLTEQKHHSSRNSCNIERHTLEQETVAISSEGREMTYNV